ncbi:MULTISPECIES: ThuA domain-containing protein [unclassified Halomonas]|uniref:ThuA domain-containing protein n=1 Tax=unclassified Halomonas TaxID=2609666 RepID=UPI0007D91375|nr:MULTISPECIES: ThuA domain-containing protein [unclassified Halomonas]MBT2785255.1 ThuA domain-containing protein [Halomonas sp. ISL-106]MBT2799276.1 ThuA domain-containing protein [Halomonas sp. ISL-104]OAL59540.1 trehalose utilization protein ThuA [Halomonas sp. ALS9]
MTINVTVWGENVHEQTNEVVARIYPDGMHHCIAEGLNEAEELNATAVTLQDHKQGLSEAILENTDVLLWWGHAAHGDVLEETVDRVQKRVLQGMGLIVLHSGHYAKIFKRLMGTTCSLKWREAGERERLWVVNPGHPIVQGLGDYIELPHTEMYGEPFAVPNPDEVIFISAFEGGEVFRSGLTYKRGNGKIFYFRPGHETYPIYYNEQVKTVLKNAVHWARPEGSRWIDSCPNIPADQAPNPVEIKGEGLHKPGEGGFK